MFVARSVLALPLSVLLSAPAALFGDFVTTSDESLFVATGAGMTVQDYSAANVPTPSTSIEGPLNSATDNGVFSPGDIVDGLVVSASPGGGNDLFVGAEGFSGRIANVVGTNFGSDALSIEFLDGANAVGLDLYHFAGNSEISAEVFDTFGVSQGTFGIAAGLVDDPSFFGIVSDGDLIGRIEFTASGFVNTYEISFGDAQIIPEPSFGLLPGLLAALVTRRRSR